MEMVILPNGQEASLVPYTNLGDYIARARELNGAGNRSEADAIIAAAQRQYPNELHAFTAGAELAIQRRDWADAVHRSQELRQRFPDSAFGYVIGARALIASGRANSAEELIEEAVRRFPKDPGIVTTWAELATARRNLSEVIRRWQVVRDLLPDHEDGYTRAAVALREAGRVAEAESLLLEGIARFPDRASSFIEYAWVAHIRRDWLQAKQRWMAVRARFPEHGHVQAAVALKELGDFSTSETILEEAIRRKPGDIAAYVEHANVAHARRDWSAATERWKNIRERFPNQLAGYAQGATAFREMRRFDEAEALLQDAAAKFPGEDAVLIDLAFLAHFKRDLDEALIRWATVRERIPQHIMGYTFAALDLKYLGRFDEAKHMLAEAKRRFPDNAAPWIDEARLSQERQDWPQALLCWEQVRSRFPDRLEAYTLGAIAAREVGNTELAERLLKDAMSLFPNEVAPALDYARLAHDRKDWDESIARSQMLRARFPERSEGYLSGARALRSLQRVGEAEALLADAESRLPSVVEIAAEHAWLAYHHHDWVKASDRFARIRARFPKDPAGYLGGAAVLSSQGMLQNAEQLLEAGMTSLPMVPALALEHAQLPVAAFLRDKKDWAEAIRRCAVLCERFPDYEAGHVVAVRTLRDAGRLDDAEALAADAKRRMPKSVSLAVEHGQIALARSQWEEAVRRFQHVMDCFMGAVDGYVGLAESLSRLARFEEAEQILQTAMARFPDNVRPFSEYAQLATRRNDLPAALQRWTDAKQRFPHDAHLSQRVFEAQLRLTETDSSQAPTAEPTVHSGTASSGKLSPREMILEFESLGGTLLGCEFGLVQRALGAEPLGLLRWSDMSSDDIINALDAEFDGVGRPENTELLVPEKDGRAEYTTRDRRFNMRMHTFVARDDAPAERLFTQLCRRLQYLKDKLIADLKSGTKIFVFKITARNLSDEELGRLRAAMRRYGNNTLLYVRYADVDNPSGTVKLVEPGLMIGYIDRFAMGKNGETYGSATVAWTAICETAYQLWRETTVC